MATLLIAYGSFAALGVICVILQMLAKRTRTDIIVGNNPQFLRFQRGYFSIYLMAMFADWLQGPYLYNLYTYYGFTEAQIAVLYVFGFASTVLLGTWAPIAADQFGRKKLCLAFTVLYSLSCLLKLSRYFTVLIVGRVLGGVATSVLFSAFEAWYIHEHIETHDFPKEWIQVTFTKASIWNGAIAIFAGVVANVATDFLGLGPVAPYLIAIPFLLLVGALIFSHWNENYSDQKSRFHKHCAEGVTKIMSSEKIFVIGIIESLFESVIYIIIFLWTPILDQNKPPLGIIFSTFMICVLIGSAVFQILSSRHVAVQHLLIAATGIALFANVILVFSVHPDKRDIVTSYIAFLIFELGIGIYFPAMGFLRSRILPEANRASIMSWFRVPINLIACAVLMLLHEDVFQHGNRWIFLICAVLLSLALLFGWRLLHLSKDDEELKQERILTESEHYLNIF